MVDKEEKILFFIMKKYMYIFIIIFEIFEKVICYKN